LTRKLTGADVDDFRRLALFVLQHDVCDLGFAASRAGLHAPFGGHHLLDP
jgi:hypothetical protein